MLRKSFKKAACRDGSAAGRLIEKIIEERPDLASETFYVPERGQMAVIDYGMAEYTVFPEQEIIRMSDCVPREYYKRFVEGYVSVQTRIDTQDIATCVRDPVFEKMRWGRSFNV